MLDKSIGIYLNSHPLEVVGRGTSGWELLGINPLTAGVAYIRVFIFLLAH